MSITDERATSNGQATAEPGRTRFGDKPHQTIPSEWDEPFIRYMFKFQRATFSKAILACLDDNAGRDG